MLGSQLLLSNSILSQTLKMEDAIAFVNQKLIGKYQFDVKKGFLKIDCFDKGKLLRHDEIELIGVDAENIVYLIADRQVVIKCRFDQAECIDRELYGVRKKTQVSRSAIEVEGDELLGQNLAKAFTHIAKFIQFPKYTITEKLE